MSQVWQQLNNGKPQCLYAIAMYRDELDEAQRAAAFERYQSEQKLVKGVHKLSRPEEPPPRRLSGPLMPVPPKDVALQFIQDSVPTVEPLPPVYEPGPPHPLNHKYYLSCIFSVGNADPMTFKMLWISCLLFMRNNFP